jgi:hypothetical protein
MFLIHHHQHNRFANYSLRTLFPPSEAPSFVNKDKIINDNKNLKKKKKKGKKKDFEKNEGEEEGKKRL